MIPPHSTREFLLSLLDSASSSSEWLEAMSSLYPDEAPYVIPPRLVRWVSIPGEALDVEAIDDILIAQDAFRFQE